MNVVIVSQDDIIAEDIYDDLCVFSGSEIAHYLPDYEILPYEERSPHYSIRASRAHTIYHVLSNRMRGTEGRFPSATYHAKPERRVAFLQRPITQSPNVGSLSFSDLSRKARTEGRFPSATYHTKPERRVAFLQRPITQSPNGGSLSFSDLSRKARTEGRFPSATYHTKPERRVAFLQRPITQNPNGGSLSFSDLSRKARTEGRFPSATLRERYLQCFSPFAPAQD